MQLRAHRHFALISVFVFETLRAILHSSISQANLGESFGMGSTASALAGAGAALPGLGGFSAYHNPASLTHASSGTLGFKLGYVFYVPSFIDINQVVTENSYVSDSEINRGAVEHDYRNTQGFQIAANTLFFPETFRLSLGFSAFLPSMQMLYVDTGETFVPDYFLYRSRTQKPQVDFGLAAQIPNTGLSLGLSFHLGYSLTSSATVFLQTHESKPSTMRFAASTRAKLNPYFGIYYQQPETSRPWTLGLVGRTASDSPVEMILKSGARAFGDFAALDFNFGAVSTLYYDPASLEWGGTVPFGAGFRALFQLDYQFWKFFKSPALFIQNPSVENCTNNDSACGIQISSGKNPQFDFRNILIPRFGLQYEVGRHTGRVGYAYRPSILKNLPTEAGNHLDPSKHIFTVGYSIRFEELAGHALPWTLSVNALHQRLITQSITKSPGDELGDLSSEKIGSPGYDAGGSVWGAGIDLTFEL